MRRSISRWTMSLATAGVLALPVSSFAGTGQEQQPQQQQPQPTQPQPAQPDRPQAQPPAQPQPQPQQPPKEQPTTPPTAQQPTASAAQSSPDQPVSPQEHLRQAQQAVASISANTVPAKNRSSLADLKRHLSNLEKMGSTSSSSTTAEPSRSPAGKSANDNKNWGTEVAAIDKIITEMVGNEATTSATSTPGATGTTGTANRPAASSATIDEATRARLMEVRTHITAYAAGMAGTSTPKTEAAASEPSPAAAAHAEPSAAAPTAAQPQSASPSQPSSAAPSAASPSSQNPTAGSQNPPATQPDPNAAAQPPSSAAGQQPPAAGQQPAAGAPQAANADEAHRHLVAARDTLSQITQLPAAAQLSGEARTQVAQLITNFNELIGNPPDWRASYKKVDTNLTTLLGPENGDTEAQGGAPTATTGATAAPGAPAAPGASATPGAVGTAGTATIELDPAIRAKLVEFRRSLSQFEKAAGGMK